MNDDQAGPPWPMPPRLWQCAQCGQIKSREEFFSVVSTRCHSCERADHPGRHASERRGRRTVQMDGRRPVFGSEEER